MVLLDQHMELDISDITFGQPHFYAPPLTPIWALHNKCLLYVYISTGTKNKIPVPFVFPFADTRTLHSG
jgi:hypothetical protein